MKLISCKGCGLVYNQEVVPFADESREYLDDGEMDSTCFGWDDSQSCWAAFVMCHCGNRIFKEEI